MMADLLDGAHRRFNPLKGEWVLVSPHRTARPWLGQIDEQPERHLPHYDPDCYLCPGNVRSNGAENPVYDQVFVFDNDFPAMTPDLAAEEPNIESLLVAGSEYGICRVMCFSPRHDLSIGDRDAADIVSVVRTWGSQYQELGKDPQIRSVQIFENRGPQMGASNPHPHCQIWANGSIPNELATEITQFRKYESDTGNCILCRYAEIEVEQSVRIVCQNQSFVALVPFWAVWPYEVLLTSKAHLAALDKLSDRQEQDLAEIIKTLVSGYDRLFDIPFPYSMGFHQQPTDGGEYEEFHMHAHYYPPLLRSATIRKFMVGYEMLAMPQRDITPEMAASELRRLIG